MHNNLQPTLMSKESEIVIQVHNPCPDQGTIVVTQLMLNLTGFKILHGNGSDENHIGLQKTNLKVKLKYTSKKIYSLGLGLLGEELN